MYDEARQAFAMVYDEKGNQTILYGRAGGQDVMYSDTWKFDGTNWRKISEEGPSPRVSAGYAYDSDKRLLILFGGMPKAGFVNDTWGIDGKDWKQLV